MYLNCCFSPLPPFTLITTHLCNYYLCLATSHLSHHTTSHLSALSLTIYIGVWNHIELNLKQTLFLAIYGCFKISLLLYFICGSYHVNSSQARHPLPQFSCIFRPSNLYVTLSISPKFQLNRSNNFRDILS